MATDACIFRTADSSCVLTLRLKRFRGRLHSVLLIGSVDIGVNDSAPPGYVLALYSRDYGAQPTRINLDKFVHGPQWTSCHTPRSPNLRIYTRRAVVFD